MIRAIDEDISIDPKRREYQEHYGGDHSYDLKRKIYTSAVDLIKNFDFSCCRCWFDRRDVWGTEEQVKCLTETGVLEVNMKFPSSMARIVKYHKKGFKFPRYTFLDTGNFIRDFGINLRKISSLFGYDYHDYNRHRYLRNRGEDCENFVRYTSHDSCCGEDKRCNQFRSYRLFLHNPELREELSQPVELTPDAIEYLESSNRYKRPSNIGWIVKDFEEALMCGEFTAAGLCRGDYLIYNEIELCLDRQDLVKEILLEWSVKSWRLQMILRDFYYKPGGPGSLKALAD